MKIELKKLTVTAVSAFATLALSSSSLSFGSKLTPYYMQIVGKYFYDINTYKKLSMVNKKYKDLTQFYYKNFVNIPQRLKDKYFPYLETYVAYPGEDNFKLSRFSGDIKHLIYLENSFSYENFVEVLCKTGVISLRSDNSVVFNDKNWSCEELCTESGEGFIIFLRGIGKKNKGRTIQFHFDPVKLSANSNVSYDIYSGVKKYNFMVDHITNILNAFGIKSSNIRVSDIVKINIPPSVKVIEDASFYGHYTLKEVNIPNGVVAIGESAFQNCINLKKVMFTDALKKIGDKAFESCIKLEEIEIPYSVEEIGDYAFNFCVTLNKIKIPDSVKNIGRECFFNCESLTEITIPGSVKYIEKGVFACCRSLKNVTILEGTEYIGEYSFVSCINLSQVSIPASVKEIYPNAFMDCPNLTEIKYNGKTYNNLNSFMTEFKNKRNVKSIKDC